MYMTSTDYCRPYDITRVSTISPHIPYLQQFFILSSLLLFCFSQVLRNHIGSEVNKNRSAKKCKQYNRLSCFSLFNFET